MAQRPKPQQPPKQPPKEAPKPSPDTSKDSPLIPNHVEPDRPWPRR